MLYLSQILLATRAIIAVVIVGLGCATASAMVLSPVPGLTRTGDFMQGVPTPEAALGFAPGARPVRYHEAVAYYQALAATSNRVRLQDYGHTFGGRRMIMLTISAPDNLSRLDATRAKLQRLGDASLKESEARDLIKALPATAWMGYGIHGNEISGSDAALELAYRMAAGQDEFILGLLRDLVIHIDPMFNADGRERALAHILAFDRRTPNEDPEDLSHSPFLPNGRGNHYFFDLNRDALYTVQQEARSRVTAIREANPQLLIDSHEMGTDNTFLFAVPAEPLNPLLPAGVHDSWRKFAADHAASFDRDGTSFYTRSWNEVFYPGYFDIWPAYLGAVPIIYEQASTTGTTLRLSNGLRRSYAQSVEHQLRSSLTNLQTAAQNREALLTRWWQARRGAAQGGASPPRAWVMLPGDDYKLTQAAETLLAQGLSVERLQRATRVSDLHSIWDGETLVRELPAGTLLIRAAQPLGALAHNLLDVHVPMPVGFLEQERRRLDLGGRTLLYDTTAWSLPHAYAADVLWSSRVPLGEWRKIASPEEAVEVAPAVVEGRYGYLYRDPSLFVTARLLQRGVKVRVTREALVHEGVRYEAGTFLIRNDDQQQSVIETLRDQHRVSGAGFVAVNGARILAGPDLGDESFQLLTQPRVAVVAGLGTTDLSVGAIMHLFDAGVGMPFTLLDIQRLGNIDLSAYNVLIIPDIWDEGAFVALLKAGRLEPLQHWVASGGTLIALRGGVKVLAAASLTSIKSRQEVIDDYPPLMFGRSALSVMRHDFVRTAGSAGLDGSADVPVEPATLPVISPAARGFVGPGASTFVLPASASTLDEWLNGLPGAQRLRPRVGDLVRRYLPQGAYLQVELRPNHWLTFGAPTRIPSMFRESDTLIAENGIETVGRYGEPRQLAMSGLLWPEAVGYIAGTAHLVRERRGAGQMILFASDPLFRGYSLGTQRLFMNAAILGPAFK